MSKSKWKPTKYESIDNAHWWAVQFDLHPTPIKHSAHSSEFISYFQTFTTNTGTIVAQKFDIETDKPISKVLELQTPKHAKPQQRLRRKGRRNQKPAKVYSVPQPPLAEFLPGPERKVTKWRYEQVRWSMDEWREFYKNKMPKGSCEIHEVLLIRYRSCGQEIEYFQTPEGHIVSRTLFDPIKFPN